MVGIQYLPEGPLRENSDWAIVVIELTLFRIGYSWVGYNRIDEIRVLDSTPWFWLLVVLMLCLIGGLIFYDFNG